MADEKKCMVCGTTDSKKWIEKTNIGGDKAYFCSKQHYEDYKKKGEDTGTCEFC